MSGIEFITLMGIAVGLSMDAFAVSITQGACLDIQNAKYPLTFGITFGLFQALMPLVGYSAGSLFCQVAQRYDHWIAFGLLAVVGINMALQGVITVKERRKIKEDKDSYSKEQCKDLSVHHLLMLGVATSIDALVVGLSLGLLGLPIYITITIIGITTFLFSSSGVYLGKKVGPFLGQWMEVAGGSLLLLIGSHIVIEHLVKGI